MSRELALTLAREGIEDQRVLAAIAEVPRHEFLPANLTDLAYLDDALPIGHSQTISQPFVVARMTGLLLQGGACSKVLEIGTGSGYQAAILSQLVDSVYTVERIKPLHQQAKTCFEKLQYNNIHSLFADGSLGWGEHAPYDAIIVTAAAESVPPALTQQLADGGRLILPLGLRSDFQRLCLIIRKGDQFQREFLDPVVFVPLKPGIED